MSPEKEKNSLMSCSDALREILQTATVLTWRGFKQLVNNTTEMILIRNAAKVIIST